jgi:hypothetical protein
VSLLDRLILDAAVIALLLVSRALVGLIDDHVVAISHHGAMLNRKDQTPIGVDATANAGLALLIRPANVAAPTGSLSVDFRCTRNIAGFGHGILVAGDTDPVAQLSEEHRS